LTYRDDTDGQTPSVCGESADCEEGLLSLASDLASAADAELVWDLSVLLLFSSFRSRFLGLFFIE
jgi:hypothetical protein